MPQRYLDEWLALASGYTKFRQRYFAQNHHIFEKLATHGQKPKTMVISCSDSRVDPSIIMSCDPGDIFVVRNVANLVPSYFDKTRNNSIGAALEFAVRHLGVENIIVMGHSHCGGIKALMEGNKTTEPSVEARFINDWVALANPARDLVYANSTHNDVDHMAKECEETALLLSLTNLKTYPFIKTKVSKGELTLHAWRFDIQNGIISRYESEGSKKFVELKAQDPEKQGESKSQEAEKPNEPMPQIKIRSSL